MHRVLINDLLIPLKKWLAEIDKLFFYFLIETATLEEPTIGDTIFTALNSTEHTATTVTGPSTSSQAHEDMRIMTRSERFSTTTEGSSGLVNTSEPQDKKILIIHIVAGVGIGTIVLIGIVVTCISLVGIMKCMQARSTKGRSDDIEEPQVVISSSNGTLLQENTAYTKSMNSWSTDTTCSDYETMSTEESIRRNTEHIQVVSSNSNGTLLQENAAYRKLMNSWSADTTGYETLSTDEGRNFDSEQPQNTSNSDDKVVGYEIMSTKEQSKPDSTQPQDSSDSNGIVVQENTAYNKSTNSRDIVGYETTSTVQDRDTNINQCSNSSGIVIHKNTAYKKSTNSWDTVTGYETMDEIVEQVMQLNQAYGFQGESQEGTDSINSGDYETMTGDLAYDYGSQTHRGMDKKSTLAMAETVTYDVLIQQQKTNPEDGEHSYDYVI